MNKGKDSKCNSTGFVACFQIGFPVFLCITHVIKGNEKTYNSWKEIPGKHRPRIYREEKIEKTEHNTGEKEKQPHLPFHDKIVLELEHESKLEPVFVQQKNQYCEHIICKCEEIYLHQRIAPIIPISSSLV